MCIVCSKVNFSQISLILLKFTYFINFYNNKNTFINTNIAFFFIFLRYDRNSNLNSHTRIFFKIPGIEPTLS